MSVVPATAQQTETTGARLGCSLCNNQRVTQMHGDVGDCWAGLPPEDTPLFEDLVRFCQNNRTAVWMTLPWLAAELSAINGFEAMLHFVRRESGAPFYIPHNLSRLNERHGLSLTTRDHERFLHNVDCRGALTVPSAFGVFLAIRRAALQTAIAAGEPDREIAQRFGATIRYVKQEKRKRRLA